MPYRAKHLQALVLQPAQEYCRELITQQVAEALEYGLACTFLRDGEPIACAGLIEIEPHRAVVWTFLGADIGRDMLYVHKNLLAYLDETPYPRIEASVDVGFDAGHRWIKMLKFEVETPLLRRYRPNGLDCVGYVRIKP